MLTETYSSPHLTVALTITLLFCALATATPATTLATPTVNVNSTTAINYNCPEDCQCVLAENTHKPFLHAQCSSIDGLKSEEALKATLPIHSIDLSHLNLARISHCLEKLHDLTSIDLSHNELHEIAHLGRRIKKLNLRHNHITSGKLSKLPQHVQVLNLQHNDITYLPLEFTRLSNLNTLELSHNQINCSCETLEVRNWIQQHHVYMEHPVVCSYPAEVKGKPWLQVKQSDICEKEKTGWYADEEENELMLGDQPFEGSGDNEDEEELGKDFMPIDKKATTAKTAELQWNDVEGSGDLSEMNLPLDLAQTTVEPPLVLARSEETGTTEMPIMTTEDEDEVDGSGSGGGIFILPDVTNVLMTDDFEDANDFKTHDDDKFDNKPVEQPQPEEGTPSPAIFGAGMGIFNTDSNDDVHSTDKPVEEEAIVPVVHHNVEQENIDKDVITDAPIVAGEGNSEAVVHAKVGEQEDSNATYFLLGVIALIVVGLILFVGIKRCKNNRNTAHDAENPRQTELLDMDKKNVGKPIHRNGNEHSPLIGEKSKSDMAKPINGAGTKKPYDSSDVKDGPAVQQQPLLKDAPVNGNATAEDLHKATPPAANEQAPHEYYPITPRYPTPKSPRASKYAQYPQGEHNNNNAEDAYLPSSPKSGRYSPVYSPETGRVKIKLTETPRPKTPMLVTRSKSNAGEIITTPVHGNNLDVPGVGNVAAAGGGLGANGHIVEH